MAYAMLRGTLLLCSTIGAAGLDLDISRSEAEAEELQEAEGSWICTPGQPCSVLAAMQKYRAAGAGLCLTTENKFGGLANTVGLVNRVYTFALEQNLQFIFPPIEPRDHDVGNSFENLFGTPGKTPQLCKPQRLKATCGVGEATDSSIGKCRLKNHTVVFKQPAQLSEACSCPNVFAFDHSVLEASYDFGLTHRELAKKYWSSHSSHMYFPKTYVRSPGSTPVTIAVHVRLSGELTLARLRDKKNIQEKYTTVEWYQSLLRGLFTRLPTSCSQVYLLTEKPDHKDIFHLRQSLLETSGLKATVYGPEVDAHEAFEVMTHADVLVAGGSGFSRLAATLRSAMDAPFPAPSFCVSKESNFKTVLGGTVVANHHKEDVLEAHVEHALKLNRPFLEQIAARCAE